MSEMDDVRAATEQAESDRELLARVKQYLAEFQAESDAVGFIEASDDNISPEESAAARELMRMMKPCTTGTWAVLIGSYGRALNVRRECLAEARAAMEKALEIIEFPELQEAVSRINDVLRDGEKGGDS